MVLETVYYLSPVFRQLLAGTRKVLLVENKYKINMQVRLVGLESMKSKADSALGRLGDPQYHPLAQTTLGLNLHCSRRNRTMSFR